MLAAFADSKVTVAERARSLNGLVRSKIEVRSRLSQNSLLAMILVEVLWGLRHRKSWN